MIFIENFKTFDFDFCLKAYPKLRRRYLWSNRLTLMNWLTVHSSKWLNKVHCTVFIRLQIWNDFLFPFIFLVTTALFKVSFSFYSFHCFRPANLLKKRLRHRCFFCQFFETFNSTSFCRAPQWCKIERPGALFQGSR